ncbi:MAG: type IV-A pilus assembly ATPase PilB [Candidatus Rokuibacteriota bacterium]
MNAHTAQHRREGAGAGSEAADSNLSATAKDLVELLAREGLVDRAKVAALLAEQRKSNDRIVALLLQRKIIGEAELVGFLSKRYRIPPVTLNAREVPAEVLGLVSPSVAWKYEVLPIEKTDTMLTLAMADPTNVLALDDIAFMTGLEVCPVIALRSEIQHEIRRHYGGQGGVPSLGHFTAPRPVSPSPAPASLSDFISSISGDLGDVEVVADDEGNGKVDVFELKESADEAPVVKLVNMVLVDAIGKGASDIHFEPYEKVFRVRFRIDGVLHEVLSPPKRLESAIISRLKIMASLDIAERRLPQDGRIKLRYGRREIDFRVSVLPTIFGEKAVLRILDKNALKLDLTQLGFDPWALEHFTTAIKQPYGMVLITGPTGSGKTTTLYSAIHTINSPDHNIMTAEDPVEYNLKGVNQVQINEGVGRTFAAALRSFLRQDPDVILVGETRDLETAQISIRAALTGHLVFSTLHTNDCPSTIARLVDMGVPPFLVSSALVLLVAQRLGRRVCKDCREPYDADEDSLVPYGHEPQGIGRTQFYKGKGCQTCNFTGLKGRVAIYEVMPISQELKDMILKSANTADLRRIAQTQGMKTLRQAGLQKVLEGVTTLDEVLRITVTE